MYLAELRTSFPFSSGHVQTLYPPLFRRKPSLKYTRQRMETSDDDFLDLDWSVGGNSHLVIILHGLEGHAGRTYVQGMGRAARMGGFDVLAMNFRGCSGVMNRKLITYHSGWTEDLRTAFELVQDMDRYRSVHLVGFSLGGNIVLKFLGECGSSTPKILRSAVGISVPCDLEDSAQALARPQCGIYTRYLLRSLKKKMQAKAQLFPGVLDIDGLEKIWDFETFDNQFTAPVYGFVDARDYWRRSSCVQYLSTIQVPSCLINAQDDPFLGPACYPLKEVQKNPALTLCIPVTGGHVGFVSNGSSGLYWSETQAIRFFRAHIS